MERFHRLGRKRFPSWNIISHIARLLKRQSLPPNSGLFYPSRLPYNVICSVTCVSVFASVKKGLNRKLINIYITSFYFKITLSVNIIRFSLAFIAGKKFQSLNPRVWDFLGDLGTVGTDRVKKTFSLLLPSSKWRVPVECQELEGHESMTCPRG